MSMQRVGVWQALRMMSLDAAYALHQDTALGTLSVGELADIIVVSGDPFAIDPNDLDTLRVLSTVVGGRARHCAPGSEALCGF
jgi:predicted amidohydrolase YtcJ